MGSLPLADAVEQSSARPTELRTKIDLPLGDSLIRALPYAAVGLRRAPRPPSKPGPRNPSVRPVWRHTLVRRAG